MTLANWLNEKHGRVNELATHLKVTRQRIWQMAKNGASTKHMLTIREFSKGEVTLDEMVQQRTK